MAYTNHNWIEESTAAARLTKLNAFISEVQAEIGAILSAEGRSRNPMPQKQLLDTLLKERKALIGAAKGSTFTRARAL